MNYYELLEVSKTATDEELKKAYREKAFKNHPDRNQGDQEAEKHFKEVNEAYQILSNPERRRVYDLTGKSTFSPDNEEPNTSGMEQELFEFLQQMGGNMHGGVPLPPHMRPGFPDFMRQRGGSHAHATIKVGLEAILNGKLADVPVTLNVPCPVCVGAGVDSTKPTAACKNCNGQGRQQFRQGNIQGSMGCNACRGTGKNYPPCTPCNGTGAKEVSKTIKVKVPPGILSGMQIQVPVDGAAALILVEHDLPERIKLDGKGNVYEDIEVTYPTIVLGGTYGVKLIDGSTPTVKIPAGTILNQGIRIKGQGVPVNIRAPQTRGDWILVVGLKVPTEVSDKERELLEQLRELK